MQKLIPLLAVLALSAVSCSKTPSFRTDEGMAWNTLYHITYSSPEDLSDSIIAVFNEIDASLSPFNKKSTVSRINDNLTDQVDSHFKFVYRESERIHAASGSLFDPTLAPLIRAWGFGQGHVVTADTLRLDSLLTITGFSKTHLTGDRLAKENPAIEFNFSALAKGYGVDCIADMLARNGVTDYLVEVGGEIRAAGVNPKGKKWAIGIDRPEEGSLPGETVFALTLGEGAVATSGNYRNIQEGGGGKFGHTISPQTGRPVSTDVLSATVVAPTCIEADALATCCMVAGSRAALDLCTRLGAAVMLIKSDLSIVYNKAFKKYLTSQNGEPEKAVRD